MTKTKTILALLAASLVVLAAIGVAYAQYVNTQNQNNAYTQTPQGYGVNYGSMSPNNGYGSYPQYPQHGGYSYGMGIMNGRGW
jgi:hypothetical protein